jgi:aldose 1-epimerase
MSTNLRLRAGDAELTVDPDRGGRLASLRVHGHELLLGPPGPSDRSIRWGCFLMAPWAGRLADGRFRWRGREWRVAQDHGRHAIHGAVYGVPWAVDRQAAAAAELSVDLGPTRWPFHARVRQRITLAPDHLELDAVMEADEPMPAAIGWHPWFRRGGDDPGVHLDADHVLVTAGMIPTGERLAVRGATDLRTGPRLGRRRLDHVYVDATSPARITWPDLALSVEFDDQIEAVVVHTPPSGFCVEPQTARPNAFSRDLAAGESFAVGLRWRWTAASREGP